MLVKCGIQGMAQSSVQNLIDSLRQRSTCSSTAAARYCAFSLAALTALILKLFPEFLDLAVDVLTTVKF